MTIGDHPTEPTRDERRKVRYGTSRQIVVAAGLLVAVVLAALLFGVF